MRLAGAGDDLSLSHAKIGRSGIASRSNAAHTKADNACCEGKPDKTPNMGGHGRILIALPCIVPTLRETTMPERVVALVVMFARLASADVARRPRGRCCLRHVFDRWQDVTAKNLSKIARR